MSGIQRAEDQQQPITIVGDGVMSALRNSVFPGASDVSIMMAVEYCKARNLDVLMKPVHLVPMSVKDQNGKYVFRDVVMPGIGLYRIQAERTNNQAVSCAPVFGPQITKEFTDKNGNKSSMSFPEWCSFTVKKLLTNGAIAEYTAVEYWEENYSVQKSGCTAPNAMWQKRPRAQIAKCAEAQALRKGWPEVGQQATAEEMEGKQHFSGDAEEKEISGEAVSSTCSNEKFESSIVSWSRVISSGKKTAEELVKFLSNKGLVLTDEQSNQLKNIKVQDKE